MSQENRASAVVLESIQEDAPVRDAAVKMKELNIGLLLVKKGNELTGIVTERDIVTRSVALGGCVCKATVDGIMSSPVISIAGDSTLDEARNLMATKQVRRVVVLNSDSAPVGVLTMDCLAAASQSEVVPSKVSELLAEATPSKRATSATKMLQLASAG